VSVTIKPAGTSPGSGSKTVMITLTGYCKRLEHHSCPGTYETTVDWVHCPCECHRVTAPETS
jgi:hypothetical protein